MENLTHNSNQMSSQGQGAANMEPNKSAIMMGNETVPVGSTSSMKKEETGASTDQKGVPKNSVREKVVTELKQLGATALGVVPRLVEGVNKDVSDAFTNKRDFWESMKKVGSTALSILKDHGLTTLLPAALSILPRIIPTIFCAEFLLSSEEATALCAAILAASSANATVEAPFQSSALGIMQNLSTATPKIKINGLALETTDLLANLVCYFTPYYVWDQTNNPPEEFFIYDDVILNFGNYYCIGNRSRIGDGSMWMAGDLIANVVQQTETGDLKNLKQLDTSMRALNAQMLIELIASVGTTLKTPFSVARPLTVLLHYYLMWFSPPSAVVGSLAPNQIFKSATVTPDRFVDQVLAGMDPFWPLSQNSVVVAPRIDAICINLIDALFFFKQKDSFVLPAGFQPLHWGVDVAVVPVSSKMRTDPATLVLWTLMFMEYPYKIPAYTGTIVDENGLLYRDPLASAQNFMSPNGALTRVIGPTARVLYVLVDDFNYTQIAPLKIGGPVNPALVPPVNYRLNPIPPLPVNIQPAIDATYVIDFMAVNLPRAYTWWMTSFGNPRDVRTSYNAAAFSMARFYEPSWYWESGVAAQNNPDRGVSPLGGVVQVIPGRGNYRATLLQDLTRRRQTMQNSFGINGLTKPQCAQGLRTLEIPAVDIFMTCAAVAGIFRPIEDVSVTDESYVSLVQAVNQKIVTLSTVQSAFCLHFSEMKGVNLAHIQPTIETDISICSSFYHDENEGLNHVWRTFTQSDVYAIPYNNITNELGNNGVVTSRRVLDVNVAQWSSSISGIMVPKQFKDTLVTRVMEPRTIKLDYKWETQTILINGDAFAGYVWMLYDSSVEEYDNSCMKRNEFSKMLRATNFDLNNTVVAFNDVTTFLYSVRGGSKSWSISMPWLDVAQLSSLRYLFDVPGANNLGIISLKADLPFTGKVPFLTNGAEVLGLVCFKNVVSQYSNPRVWSTDYVVSDMVNTSAANAVVPYKSLPSFGPTTVGIGGLGLGPSKR